MRVQQIQSHLNTLDYKVTEVSSLLAMLKTEKQQYEQSIERTRLRLVQMNEIEQQVDKQVVEILGRAINGDDLKMMYELDLKMLNQINSKGDNP